MAIEINGLIVKSPKEGQPIEMQANTYKIHGDVIDPDSYPITKNEHTLEYLRTVPNLRIRTDVYACVARIKSVLLYAAREYFNMLGFREVDIPLITDNECESGCNPFLLTTLMSNKINDIPVNNEGLIDYSKDFFQERTFLTVSGQLHLECMVLGGLNKAFTMTNAFRAEPSMSPLHAASFQMLELEFCFNTLEENMQVNEGGVKHCITRILEKCFPDLELLQHKFKPGLIKTLEKYTELPFIVATHEDCVKKMLVDIDSGKVIINPNKKIEDGIIVFKEVPTLDSDLTKDHEKYITQIMYDEIPVFVKEYPAAIKSFYMPKINKGNAIERVKNFDLLVPYIGECIGGSQRETDYDELRNRMIENGIKPEKLQFYLDLRKYGTVEHGGSGWGIERLLLAITGLTNIRDMIPFPRFYKTCLF